MATLNESDLSAMLQFIRGEGEWRLFGGSISTYPDQADDAKHEMCLELERRGLIKRWVCSTETAVTWVDINKPDWVDPDDYPSVVGVTIHTKGGRFVKVTPIIVPARNEAN